MASEITKEKAVALAESGWWKNATDKQIVDFQLFEERLCMDFGRFQEAVEKVLGRPVFTHEFARPDLLRSELAGDRPRPGLEGILNLIPAEKRVVILGL